MTIADFCPFFFFAFYCVGFNKCLYKKFLRKYISTSWKRKCLLWKGYWPLIPLTACREGCQNLVTRLERCWPACGAARLNNALHGCKHFENAILENKIWTNTCNDDKMCSKTGPWDVWDVKHNTLGERLIDILIVCRYVDRKRERERWWKGKGSCR